MVDFGKRLAAKGKGKPVDPIKLYDGLDRASDKGPLRPAQESILRDWHDKHRDERDVIVKLHTGQGKTLIGLAILQSRLNQRVGPSLYICPNIYLAQQTALQAAQFGIDAILIDEDIPAEFLDGKAILISHVQKVFNGLTKFKLRSDSVAASTVVLDDAHACIDAIKSAFTIRLSSDHQAYRELVTLFSSDLESQGVGTFADIKKGEYGAFLPVPYWAWMDKEADVAECLSRHAGSKEVKFAWPLIRDCLSDCLCVVSGTSLEIAPYIPNLDDFGTFARASHRVFMSATTMDDSFLIKGLGVSREAVEKPLHFAGEKWSGEKMILLPSLLDESLTRSEIAAEHGPSNAGRKVGRVVLVPSANAARMWANYGASIASADNIGKLLNALRTGNYQDTVVIVNRYDGIDLPDASCRILILDSRPQGEALADRYEDSVRCDSTLTRMKTARTIEQGLGRGVRGEKDYCVVLLAGDALVEAVRGIEGRRLLSEQTRKQIEIGLQVCEWAREEISETKTPMQVLRELILQCVRRDANWKTYYSEEMNKVSGVFTANPLLDIIVQERVAGDLVRRLKYEAAAEKLQELADSTDLSEADRGWYVQEMARTTYRASKAKSTTIQAAAHGKNRYLLRPQAGFVIERLVMVGEARASNIKKWIKTSGEYSQLMVRVNGILASLSFGVDSDRFELAMDELGKALGFVSERPDKEWKEGPDNLWGLRESEYLLIECKSEVDTTRAEIVKSESGQMNNGLSWFQRHYRGASSRAWIVHPAKVLGKGAGFNAPVSALREKGLRRLNKNVQAFFGEFRNIDLKDISDENLQKLLVRHSLTLQALSDDYAEPCKTK